MKNLSDHGGRTKTENCTEIDSLKGVLILFIALGHNTYFSSMFPAWYSFLYKFHVASFLILPFLFPLRDTTFKGFGNRVFRYLIPHYSFFLVVAIIYFMWSVEKDWSGIMNWGRSVILAATVSSQYFFKQATGFYYFWFLPALSVLTLIRTIYAQSPGRLRLVLIFVIIQAHLFVGLIPIEAKNYIPCSLCLVCFLFPFGILAELSHVKSASIPYKVAFLFIFIILIYCEKYYPLDIAIAGEEREYAVISPLKFIFQDLFIWFAFCGTLSLSTFINCSVLRALGKNSLVIFLTHSLIFQAYLKVVQFFGIVGVGGELYQVVFSFTVTIFLSYFLSRAIYIMPALERIVFPKSWDDWWSPASKIKV